MAAAALLWLVPFAWMGVASLRQDGAGSADLASLLPSGRSAWQNFVDAWSSGHFPLWYFNTHPAVRRHPGNPVRHRQPRRLRLRPAALSRPGPAVHVFLLQLMLVPPILIVPNLRTLVALHLYDTLAGVMAPYCRLGVRRVPDAPDLSHHSARLRRSRAARRRVAHRRSSPTCCCRWRVPGLAAFAIVSVTTHWNEFLWPLMVTSSPSQSGADGGSGIFTAGAEAGSEWGVIAAGTFLVAAPLLVVFVVFQRRFVAASPFPVSSRAGRRAHASSLRISTHDRRVWTERAAPVTLACDARSVQAAARRDRDRSVLSGSGAGQARQSRCNG